MMGSEQVTVYLPLAHLTHWYFIALYLAPPLLIVASAIRTTLKERRKAREGQATKGPGERS